MTRAIGSPVIQLCPTKTSIISGGGNIIENNDGTVSVFTMSNINGIQPYYLNKSCCEFLSPNYYFDIINQQCRWAQPIDCTSNPDINVILNPKGNDGNVFSIQNDENCTLKIDFDYLLEFSCDNLSKLTQNIIQVGPQQTGNTNNNTNKLISQTNLFENPPVDDNFEYLTSQLNYLTDLFNNTSYSIEGFGKIYCLTDAGLIQWSNILSAAAYNSFINGDTTVYTINDITTLISNNNTIVINENSTVNQLIYECNVDPTTKGIIKQQIVNLEQQISTNQSNLKLINTGNTETAVGTGLGTIVTPIKPDCSSPVAALESLALFFSLDLFDSSANTISKLFEYEILAIGSGNLFTYLQTSINSGLSICGDSNCGPFVLNDPNLTGYCRTLSQQIINQLISEAALKGITLTTNNLNTYVPTNSFNSNWLHFSLLINNPTLLSSINNQKIKISLRIKNTCLDTCILLDNIKVDKICDTLEKQSLFISKSPSFELKRVIDNKKSWVAIDDTHERIFDLTLRETDYNINNYKLAINTKEVDLDISSAKAIESDVWCYINNNPCILTGICSEEIVTCGDGCINLNDLITTSFSAITTIEKFKDLLTSELIDVKSRKTIRTYPTLRLLYDRYLNSLDFCDIESAKFNYMTMDRFAGLIGNYWVDLIEQVIPSTTIWGATYLYNNTIFDSQKFEYKTGNLYPCNVPNNIPFSAAGSATTVEILQTTYTFDGSGNTFISQVSKCNNTYVVNNDCGSEFLGTIVVFSGSPIGNNIPEIVIS